MDPWARSPLARAGLGLESGAKAGAGSLLCWGTRQRAGGKKDYQWTRQFPPCRRHWWMKVMHSLKCLLLGGKNKPVRTGTAGVERGF